MFSLYARCIARASPCVRSNAKLSFRYLTNTAQQAKTLPKKLPKQAVAPQVAVERGRSERIGMLATQIFNAGRSEIYKNTASNGFIATSLTIMTMSYCGIGYIYSTRLWDLETAKARGLHWLVPVAYQITMICWGVFAAYALTRTFSVIKSIKLVKSGDKLLLETLIRRPVPFLRPEKYLSEPHTLVVNRAKLYGAAHSEGMITAPEGETLGAKLMRKFFYTPFHNTRKSLGGVGLLKIQVGPTGAQRHLVLDADGQFSKGGQDFLDLSKDEI